MALDRGPRRYARGSSQRGSSPAANRSCGASRDVSAAEYHRVPGRTGGKPKSTANDGLRPGMSERRVVLPIEVLVSEHAFRHGPGIVHRRTHQVAFRRRRIVSASRPEIPASHPRDRRRKGIQEKLVEIKTMAFLGLVRTVHPVGIELTGTNPLNPDVPHVTRAVARGIEINHPGSCGIFGMIKQLQPNAAGVAAEEAKFTPSPDVHGFPEAMERRLRTSVRVRIPLPIIIAADVRTTDCRVAIVLRIDDCALCCDTDHRCHRIRAASRGTATPSRCGISAPYSPLRGGPRGPPHDICNARCAKPVGGRASSPAASGRRH